MTETGFAGLRDSSSWPREIVNATCPSSVSFFYLSEGREKTLLPIEWRVIAAAKSFSFCKLKPGAFIHSLSIIYALRHCVVVG